VCLAADSDGFSKDAQAEMKELAGEWLCLLRKIAADADCASDESGTGQANGETLRLPGAC
jgi:hypothetical protein